jgi:two-component system OmpR family response regulator
MSIDFTSRRILIVDDQLLVRSLLGQVMHNLGFRPEAVSQATDGNNALRVLDLRSFDIILCDIQMDPINGVDLLKELRCARTPNASNTPFVFLSGHPERSTIMLAAQFHADGFIVKPPKPSEIEKNLEVALARPRPPIDPFHYLSIATGSDYDQRNFGRQIVPPQSRDLDMLLARFKQEESVEKVHPGAILAQDLHAADGRPLLQRGVKITQVQLNILKKFQPQYGVSTLSIAHLPSDQMIMYQEMYGL